MGRNTSTKRHGPKKSGYKVSTGPTVSLRKAAKRSFKSGTAGSRRTLGKFM